MPRARADLVLAATLLALVLSPAACGKKAPLRLSDDRAASRAPALQALVREGRVMLDFRVPPRRFFPEREEPWVLARILRQSSPSADAIEAGAILEKGGFAFEAPLSWSDAVMPPGSFIYRVEFRDAVHRRRALSDPLAVGWDRVPEAPPTLSAGGQLRSIALAWTAPGGSASGVTYRVYRREPPQQRYEAAAPGAAIAELGFVDSRVEPDREYCYVVRAALSPKNVVVEGPASPEACSRPTGEDQPPARPASDPP